MSDKKLKIPVDATILNVILMCIIEHWPMPQYKRELTKEEFAMLEKLRSEIFTLRDSADPSVLEVAKQELDVIIKAFEIGFKELVGAEDFRIIVGKNVAFGEEIFLKLKETQSSSRL